MNLPSFCPTIYLAAVGVLLATAVLAGAVPLLAGPPSAEPPTAAAHEAAVAWCRIRTLRQEVGLTNHGLAAMACTQAQAETALSSLVSWYNTNREALAARRAAVHSASCIPRSASSLLSSRMCPSLTRFVLRYRSFSGRGGTTSGTRSTISSP